MILKFEQWHGFTLLHQKDADEMANTDNPLRSSLIWVYKVFPDLSVWYHYSTDLLTSSVNDISSSTWDGGFSGWKYMSHLVRKCVVEMSHITRKPVFGVCDQVRLKLACTAIKTSKSLEISDLATIGIILSRKQANNKGTDQTLQADLLLCCAYMALVRVSHDVAQII